MLHALQCFMKSYFKTVYIIVHIFCNIAMSFSTLALDYQGLFILLSTKPVFCNINEHFYGYKYLKDLLHTRTNYGWLFHEIARGFDLTILLLVYIHSVAGEQNSLQSKFSDLVLLICTIVYLSVCSLNCILQSSHISRHWN